MSSLYGEDELSGSTHGKREDSRLDLNFAELH